MDPTSQPSIDITSRVFFVHASLQIDSEHARAGEITIITLSLCVCVGRRVAERRPDWNWGLFRMCEDIGFMNSGNFVRVKSIMSVFCALLLRIGLGIVN